MVIPSAASGTSRRREARPGGQAGWRILLATRELTASLLTVFVYYRNTNFGRCAYNNKNLKNISLHRDGQSSL